MALGTGGRQRQILDVQRRQILLEPVGIERSIGQPFGGASLERAGKCTLGYAPTRGTSLLIEARDESRAYPYERRGLFRHDPGRDSDCTAWSVGEAV